MLSLEKPAIDHIPPTPTVRVEMAETAVRLQQLKKLLRLAVQRDKDRDHLERVRQYHQQPQSAGGVS